jgi:hypothetical protein
LFRENRKYLLVNTLNTWKFCQVIVSERAETIDIIRYLLSYTYSSSDSFSDAKELIDSAVRNIMAELVSFTAESTSKPSSLSQHERFSRPPGQNIEMKRGDWICTRCANSTILFPFIFQVCFALCEPSHLFVITRYMVYLSVYLDVFFYRCKVGCTTLHLYDHFLFCNLPLQLHSTCFSFMFSPIYSS